MKFALTLGSVACLTLLASVVSAATLTMPVTGGGSLTMTWTNTTSPCNGIAHQFLNFTNFSYSADTVTNPGLLTRFDTADFPCVANHTYTLRLQSGCTILFNPTEDATLSCTGVSGYVGPKYMIVGVSYAPPGPSSFVQYSTGAFFGTTTSLMNSFSSNTSVNVSVSAGAKEIGGWLDGKLTVTGSSSATQTSTDSSSATVSIQNLFTTRLPGTPNAFSPVNHDYDLIWLWLNPVMIFTVYPKPPSFPSVMTWNGYGYSSSDQPAMDIWPIEVGYLNGHFGPLPFTDASVLARSWAANQVYPPGQGPGLTSQDFANILRADPFADPSYAVTLSTTAIPVTTVDGRFTISGVTNGSPQSFVYRQPAPGSLPLIQTLTSTYTNTSSLGRTSSYQSQVGYGIEASMSASFFGVTFGTNVRFAATLTHTHQSGTSVTSTTTQVDTLSIAGPPCGSNTSPCVPVYTGPPEFNIYQDNVFGTFMFNPVN